MPPATRAAISLRPKVPTSNPSTLPPQGNVRLLSGVCGTARYHQTSTLLKQHSIILLLKLPPPPTNQPTLVEWFAKTIEVTNNRDNYVGRMFAINDAMAVVPDISEA